MNDIPIFPLFFHPLSSTSNTRRKRTHSNASSQRQQSSTVTAHAAGAYTFFYLHFFSFLSSQLVFRNAFFVYTGPAALRCTLGARALTPFTCIGVETRISLIYTYTYSERHVYTAYIFDICVRLLWRERLCVSSRTWPLGACALLSTRRVARW